MPPMRKVELDKAAWAWCNDVEPEKITDVHVATAYRLNVSKCGFSKCRRNCQGNPFCLNGLGESKWMSDHVKELPDDDELHIEFRKPETFVGLRNLGATCYINSLLQLWFHNIAFRNSILRWNPKEDPVENSAIAHLQFLFTLMQFGKKKSVDPSDFISSLEIDVSLQQDAREFSQLFISYLEDYLKRQSDPIVRNLINNNFQGHYNYVTRCSKCHTDSIRESTFYELEVNVKGHRTLDESIAEFLKEEKLEGDDMYNCCVCQSKQEATRHIELSALPPVFNLQLIRFIYDRQKGMKKKLNTPLQFPETLDMGPYLKKGKDGSTSVKYNLFAVLIHKGPSANSGHYVAHICDQTHSNWYMFNDESTQKIEGKKLKLNSDEDYDVDEGGKKQKAIKAIKGYLCSSNAYMLVYTASDCGLDKTPITDESLQPHLKTKLQEYNETFDSMISQSREEKRTQLEDENLMKAEMASFLSTLPVDDNSEWEAISRKWLTNWISANSSTGFYPVENKHFTCIHNKINPSLIKDFKFINKEVANNIYEKYGGGPRLDKNDLCKECVKINCLSTRAKTKIANDHKEISNLVRAKENIEPPSFWIGKESLRTWKTKALKEIDKTEEMIDDTKDVDSAEEKKDLSPYHDVMPSIPYSESKTFSNYKEEYSPSSDSLTERNFPVKRIYSISTFLESAYSLTNRLHELMSFVSESDPTKSDRIAPKELLHSLISSSQIFFLHLQLTNIFKGIDFNVLVSSLTDLKENTYGNSNDVSSSTDEAKKSSTGPSSPKIENGSAEDDKSYELQHCPEMNGKDDENGDGLSSPPSKRRKVASDEEKDREGSEDGKMNGNKSDDDEDEDYEFNFNEDIVCVHGNLCVKESSRRLVPEQAWIILKTYFPECKEFSSDTEPCVDCQCLVSEGKVAKDLHKQQATKEKELLCNLYMGRNRPKAPYVGSFHILSENDFVKPWRKFIREPTKRDPMTSLRNCNLLCTHGGLKYDPRQTEEIERLCFVTNEEWDKISTNFKVDKEITIDFSELGDIVTNPAVCTGCVADRVAEEQQALLQYNNAKLYIRQMARAVEESCLNPSQQHKDKNAAADGPIRRSSRNKRSKLEKVFRISSDQTLLSLKLEILHWLGVSPFDQHLMFENGNELTDHKATLSSLSVFPDSVIYLKVDEPVDESSSEEGVGKKSSSEPEHGFKGTGLLKR